MQKRFERKTERKQNKKKEAEDIINQVKKNCERLLERFCEKYKITQYAPDKNQYERLYLLHYLTELKYRFRTENREKEGEERADGTE